MRCYTCEWQLDREHLSALVYITNNKISIPTTHAKRWLHMTRGNVSRATDRLPLDYRVSKAISVAMNIYEMLNSRRIPRGALLLYIDVCSLRRSRRHSALDISSAGWYVPNACVFMCTYVLNSVWLNRIRHVSAELFCFTHTHTHTHSSWLSYNVLQYYICWCPGDARSLFKVRGM